MHKTTWVADATEFAKMPQPGETVRVPGTRTNARVQWVNHGNKKVKVGLVA